MSTKPNDRFHDKVKATSSSLLGNLEKIKLG